MLIFILTFLLTTGLWGGLLWWLARRVVRHLQTSPEGRQAICEHLLTPMLCNPEIEPEDEAEIE